MEIYDEKSPLFPEKREQPKPQRTVGVLAASAVVFGNCIGAGIFISPRGVYERAGSAGAGLVIWAVSGVIATLCTLAYAELGTMMPESGGEFVYINKVYGKCLGFLFTFCNAFLIRPASLSVVAILFAEDLCNLIWGHPVNPLFVKAIGAALILSLMLVNIVGVDVVAKFCSVASMVKLAVVGFLLVCGVAIVVKGQGQDVNFQISSSFKGSSTSPADYGLAFYYCLFTFQSWNSLNYMTEELKNPVVTLPLGGFIGVTGVAVSNLLSNIAYLMLFTVHEIAHTNAIAMDSGYAAFGRPGEVAMSIGLLISCVGTIGGAICCTSRNVQSTAEKGVFPNFMGGINRTFRTPIPAVVIVSITTCVYLLFDASSLIPFMSTVEWLFYCITFSIILYLRYKLPHVHRPFKVPVCISALLFLITGTFVILPLFSEGSRKTVLLGLCWLPLGLLLYATRYLVTRCCYNPYKGPTTKKHGA